MAGTPDAATGSTPRRGRRRATGRRPPLSLAALLGIVFVVGVIWAITVPPWQSPDEVAHYAYAESLAAGGTLPGHPTRPEVSSDQGAADASVGASRGAFYPLTSPPDWSRADWLTYLRDIRAAPPPRGNGGGPNPAIPNPPLSYLVSDLGYVVDPGGTAFGRLYAMQLVGVLLLLATTLGTWLLCGEVLGRRRLPQLAGAAVAGLLPMVTFMSTAVNPDALLIACWTFALWLGARVINRGARRADVIAICAVTAAGILTKATTYALVPAVGLALAGGWWRRPATERRRAAIWIGVGLVGLALPVIAWFLYARSHGSAGINQVATSAAHPFNVRQFLSYVWQFYLPRLPFLTPFRTTPQLPVYDIWLRQATGMFGWLDVPLPDWAYRASGLVLTVIALGTVWVMVRTVRRRHLVLLGFFGLAVIGLLGLLHVSDYLSILAGEGQFVQGRYLLPVVGLLGLAVATIVRAVPLRLRPTLGGLTLTMLLGGQAVALATVLQAYYL
jgi:4-amino-4-deoxy-L-arabinose transferase-like glycosyltransferase